MTREIATSLSSAISSWTVIIASALGLAACSGPTVVESSATAVSVRYDSVVNSIEDATQFAQKACALHHKTARLRNTANFGLRERYGHFDCV